MVTQQINRSLIKNHLGTSCSAQAGPGPLVWIVQWRTQGIHLKRSSKMDTHTRFLFWMILGSLTTTSAFWAPFVLSHPEWGSLAKFGRTAAVTLFPKKTLLSYHVLLVYGSNSVAKSFRHTRNLQSPPCFFISHLICHQDVYHAVLVLSALYQRHSSLSVRHWFFGGFFDWHHASRLVFRLCCLSRCLCFSTAYTHQCSEIIYHPLAIWI